jgi:hypothetical protein
MHAQAYESVSDQVAGAYFFKRLKRNRKLRFLFPTFASSFHAVIAVKAHNF